MAWMKWSPYLEGRTVADPASDHGQGVRIEQYRISASAVYFPREKYLLLSDIRRTWIQSSQMNVIGCCGKGLPVSILRIDAGEDVRVNLVFEKRENAEKAISLFLEANPGITVETWTREAQLAGTAPR